ncbi:alpha-amylase family glycosyl hydrolase [Levilinea saccharolytica]|uniref:Alpha-amylase n=1 Tax=Levilinea saccharolytica TaxID=229921 RepID=A0A0P6Y280_9CHLR|nr:alpha-amylase family glycosyl hydrolase [Levilinea saccharolytica]KPL91775.1 alpha-amylase [Levilinea saccharolytica]GAP17584.1 glycosidase [Levilinea saccharolytica]
MEFHISRQARDRYQLDQSLFSLRGSVLFANFHAARLFAQKMNQRRDLIHFPERAVLAGQINAMGLIDEILHHVMALYRRQVNPTVMRQALEHLNARFGAQTVHQTLLKFNQEFPPVAVYRREVSAEEDLQGESEGQPNAVLALEEMLMLWVANKNPAMSEYEELFNDQNLQGESAYLPILQELHAFFDAQPPFGPDQQNLIDMLRAPAVAVPHSLTGQLEFIRTRWGELLGRYLYRLLSSLDLVKEEEKLSFAGFGPGPIPIPLYDRSAAELEAERFSPDREWMPRLVLLAKNSYVWLDQLSKTYKRPIHTLDQIPDEELDRLARYGFTGLWLIGLWERSQASARIKQLCGNPEAIASAYSLSSYSIAADLGGEDAYRSLRDRAWQRGIRLASDMVPNHMGIDSNWVLYHPDRFVSLDYSPFPSYSFNGPDLSPDPRIEIQLEDHYFDRTDASVVFKWHDRSSGQTRFMYHGNDGTSMPWNDTAQLNYLNPEVREAIIQTILDVARKFPIIRFDAAMTLAKKHYQRLWFPEPGSGGDIPSRAEHGLTRAQFDALMPIEFWREVVDRAAVEAPDTLLLAEAFWLMEGYFVRTLGMHRVYNSAFMNLLRNEDNAKYRTIMKNTLEFEPEILKRFVNFMNNPDERTAVDQFGKGDKYFGTCIMLATLPGLPMFGHGQVEGFSEKYGMEFRRAYWEEAVDPHLVARHEREIFPLLHRRALFAGIDHFLLYDFFTSGGVNEDVYAYSNGLGGERALVVYHNRFASTQGWIRMSAATAEKQGSERRVVQRSLYEGLNLRGGANSYVLFRDSVTNLEFIRPSREVQTQGLYLDLHAYQAHVFMDFREVQDNAHHSYQHLCAALQGRGVPSIEEALETLLLQPVQTPFRQIAHPAYLDYLYQQRLTVKDAQLPQDLFAVAAQKMDHLLDGIAHLTGQDAGRAAIQQELRAQLDTLLHLPILTTRYPLPGSRRYTAAVQALQSGLIEEPTGWLGLFSWVFVRGLGQMIPGPDSISQSLSWFEEWQLGRILSETYKELGVAPERANRLVLALSLLTHQQGWFERTGHQPLAQILESWLSDPNVQSFLGVNRYQDVLWFNHESFVEFIQWMGLLAVLDASADPQATASQFVERILSVHDILHQLEAAEETSGYQVAALLSAVQK